MPNITSSRTIEKLRQSFQNHGLPREIVTDNGQSFMSDEFKKNVEVNEIKHITSPLYHPSTNSFVERQYRQLKENFSVYKVAPLKKNV